MNALFGKKLSMTQRYDEKGILQTVTVVSVEAHTVTGTKSADKHGYDSVVVGVGTAAKTTKALRGTYKETNVPKLRKEIRGTSTHAEGTTLQVADVFNAGDLVRVTGTTKGKGFTGVVKRHGFAGGPKTHGQSDRHRAPGSIGAGTTMGRVLKGLRMAGRSGGEQLSVRNLVVLHVREDGMVYLSGPIPGHYGSLVRIEKIGEKKNFSPIVLLDSDQYAQDSATETQVEATPVEEKTEDQVAEAQVEEAKE